MEHRKTNAIWKSFLFMLVAGIIFSAVFATVWSTTNITPQSMAWIFPVAIGLILISGGFIAGIKGRERGWLLGLSSACLFFITILLLQFLGFNQAMGSYQLLYVAAFLPVAAAGGIIGVNVGQNE
ncbi:TIGR04086 family membrane protein [Salsuginibacillus kocurii]|uniref:TIGR04086 family membrane protein n=1 Tax=Salsuginibacillus kocurii TaxID=427078 RepID=UPI00037C4849|nr:TIGR04086 family membrane protein [Salsuginibacillus kocurii]